MRRILIAVAVVATLGFSGSMADPGPNGRNNYGLCKAYFSGSENGRANKRQAPPFQALERAADVDEDDTPEERAEKVADYCADANPGGKQAAPGRGAGKSRP